MSNFIKIALALIVLMVAGCASMSKGECQSADWQSRGLSDGRAGASPGRIQAHREACAKAGITPDEARWRAGWAEGVKAYCTPNSAWNAGVNNATYYGACTDLDEATFLRYHRAGQLVYRAQQEINQNKSTTARLDDELKKATKEDDRKRLRDELQRADRERVRLLALLVTLELAGPPR